MRNTLKNLPRYAWCYAYLNPVRVATRARERNNNTKTTRLAFKTTHLEEIYYTAPRSIHACRGLILATKRQRGMQVLFQLDRYYLVSGMKGKQGSLLRFHKQGGEFSPKECLGSRARRGIRYRSFGRYVREDSASCETHFAEKLRFASNPIGLWRMHRAFSAHGKRI